MVMHAITISYWPKRIISKTCTLHFSYSRKLGDNKHGTHSITVPWHGRMSGLLCWFNILPPCSCCTTELSAFLFSWYWYQEAPILFSFPRCLKLMLLASLYTACITICLHLSSACLTYFTVTRNLDLVNIIVYVDRYPRHRRIDLNHTVQTTVQLWWWERKWSSVKLLYCSWLLPPWRFQFLLLTVSNSLVLVYIAIGRISGTDDGTISRQRSRLLGPLISGKKVGL